jgi:hypothetical protein
LEELKMKTNLKNGAFLLGEIPVDTAQIKIAGTLTGEGINFNTRADGLYPVIAETDENGIVTHLVIDVSRYNFIFNSDVITEIDEEDIVVNNGEYGELSGEEK